MPHIGQGSTGDGAASVPYSICQALADMQLEQEYCTPYVAAGFFAGFLAFGFVSVFFAVSHLRVIGA